MLEWKKDGWKALISLAPAMIILIIFTFYPIINTFVVSFFPNYNYITDNFFRTYSYNSDNGGWDTKPQNVIFVFKETKFTF